jgi:hypothetical protein
VAVAIRDSEAVREEEETFIRTFVRRENRERWLQLLASPKSRSKITQRLYDGPPGDFDPKLVQAIEKHTDADGLLQQLGRLGAPQDCWIISAHSDDDGTVERLADTVASTYGGWRVGIAVICTPDRLAYVEAETERFLLRAG